jgi:HEPN domain-containing protein
MKKATKAWMEYSGRDLEAARILLRDEYVANVVIFHSQQCVEKCLKALLEENSIVIPKTHSIVKLHSLIPEHIRKRLSLEEEELDLIDIVYIDTRYPGAMALLPSGFPTKDEAEQLFKIASHVFETVIEKMAG